MTSITDRQTAKIERLIARRQPQDRLSLGSSVETGAAVWWTWREGPLLLTGDDPGVHAATGKLTAQATARRWAVLETHEEEIITPTSGCLVLLIEPGDVDAGARVAQAHPDAAVVVRTANPTFGGEYAARAVYGHVSTAHSSRALDAPSFALPERRPAAMCAVGDGPVIPLRAPTKEA